LHAGLLGSLQESLIDIEEIEREVEQAGQALAR
jgi:hypothetical protein